MGNAGTAMRLFMGLLAPQTFDSTLVGDSSLMKRPMERVAVPLRLMGASITTQNGMPPVEIRGGQRLRAIDYDLPVASAQVKSAILLAGACAPTGRTRVVEPAPTRDHTERMLAAFGVEMLAHGAQRSPSKAGRLCEAPKSTCPATSPPRRSSWCSARSPRSRALTLRDVGINPTRTGLLDMLAHDGRGHPRASAADGAEAGQRVGEPIADIEVQRQPLRGITVPEALVPLSIDEFPVFFIAAACAEGETLVRGAHELRVKESDRLAVMAEGLGALGVEHELLPDGIWIRGGAGFSRRHHRQPRRPPHRHGLRHGERACLAAPSRSEDVANVATSFPGFVADRAQRRPADRCRIEH